MMSGMRNFIDMRKAGKRTSLKIVIFLFAIFAALLLNGCTNSPVAVAKFFLESQIKGNDQNAQSLVVSGQKEMYSGSSGGFGTILSEELGYDEPTPEAHAVARILAGSLVISLVEKSGEKAVVEYRFNVDKIRKEFEKKGYLSASLLDSGLRESALAELGKLKGTMVLVPENGEWKIDLIESSPA